MENEIKILHLEDETKDFELIKELIGEEFNNCNFTCVSSEGEFTRLLKENHFDMILSDFSMPAFDGLSALSISRIIKPEIPFIFVSGHIGEERAIEALRKGAVDYVLKDKLEKLIPTIKRVIKETEEKNKRKIAEEALRNSEKKYRLLVENINDVIFSLNHKGIITYLSPAIKNYTDFSPNEMIGKNFKKLILKDDWHKIKDNFKKSLNGLIEPIEFRYIGKNKEHRWGRTSGTQLIEENKKVGILGVVTDITEKKLYEIELKNAKNKAEELNNLKSNFLRNMSHELRTPLIGILGYAELLIQELRDDDLREMSNVIFKSGNRLLKTLNLILNLSLIEAENLEISLETFNLNILVKEISGEFKKDIHNKNLKFGFESYDEEINIRIDKSLFVEIINNLLKNAIKYTNRGSIHVQIETESFNNNKWAVVKIIDTGIGIPEDSIKIIFDPFRQASEGHTRSFEGAGLGLTITKIFVEKLNGKIEIKSEKDIGTEVTLKFPMGTNENKISDTGNKDIPYEDENKHQQKINILLVEDDYATIFITKEYLNDICNLSFTTRGDAALKKIKEKKYNAVLLDINLGEGLSGLDIVKEIKKIPSYDGVPLIAFTAYAMMKDKEEFMSAGFTHYISKPFDKKQLTELIKKCINKQ